MFFQFYIYFKPFAVCSDYFCSTILQGLHGAAGWPGPKGQKGADFVVKEKGAVYLSVNVVTEE